MYNPVAELLCGILGIIIIMMAIIIIVMGVSSVFEYMTGIVILAN